MSLSSLSARRPVGTAMIYVCVVVLGVVASRQLAVDLMPEVDMPRVSVTTTYNGVAPEEIESLLTRPMEQALSTIEGVDRLNSTSAEGISRVEVWFEWGKDLDEAVNDIRERIDRVRSAIPDDADPPSLWKFNLSDMPIAFLGLRGSGDIRQLRYLAEEILSRRLERVAGVANVDVRGGRVREIQVLLDPHRLAALSISPRQVTQALGRENRNVSAGDMIESGKEVLIRTMGELRDTESVEILIELLNDNAPGLEPLILESLGRIGGPRTRETLRQKTGSSDPKRARIAFKALSLCATQEDDFVFRDAITHSDWYIRLSCAEVLGRFVRSENMAALAQLAADPVPIVAQRALSFLES